MKTFYVILTIVFWIACGVFSVRLRDRKGYSGGFVSGFLFGVFSVLYNISLPDLVVERKIAELRAKIDCLSQNYLPKEDKQSESAQDAEKNLTSNKKVTPFDEENQCRCPICNFAQPKGRLVCWNCGAKFDRDGK